MKNNSYKFGFVILLVASTFFFNSNLSHADVWYVDAGVPPGGDGKSWATAFRDIQSAINAASSIWTICFSPKDQIWVKQGTYRLTNQINVNKVVIIYGGFSGGETMVSQRDWKYNITTVDGQNAVRCFSITKFCEINGLIIKNGDVAAGGGAMYINSTPVYCHTMNSYHTPRIRNCTIWSNSADNGGGIYDNASSAHIENCSFLDNSSTFGGAIFSLNACPKIRQSLFIWNQSTAMAGNISGGGAIHVQHVCYSPPCDDPTECPSEITNCLFFENDAENNGGAISLYGRCCDLGVPEINVKNCTFTKNEANRGGAVIAYNAWSYFNNCIFWGDVPANDEIYDYTGSSAPYINYSDIQGGYSGPGSNNIDEDPLFLSTVDSHLAYGSPCIDKGLTHNAPNEDLEGTSRPLDGDGDGTATTDMGAYEFILFFIGDFDLDRDVDGLDLHDLSVGGTGVSLPDFAEDFGNAAY